jgi:hypothetical protein
LLPGILSGAVGTVAGVGLGIGCGMGLPACAKALNWTKPLKNKRATSRTEKPRVEPLEGTEVLAFKSRLIR